MGKGILLELEGRQAVVLTPQGEFKRIPLPKGAWDIGDEISYAETKPVSWTRWGVWASAAAVMLMVGFQGYTAWSLTQPVALLTIDINPSLQFTLNKRSEVLKAVALNQDGAAVLEGVQWQGGIWSRHSVDDVVAQVTAKAVEIGKLAPEDASGAVVVAVAPAQAEELPVEQSGAILAKSRVAANETIAKKATEKHVEVKAKVAAVVVTKQEKEEAEKAGLTPGKWAIYQQIQESVPEVKPEEIIEKGPGKVIHELDLNANDIFGKAEEKHDGKHEEKAKEKEEKKGGKAEEQPAAPASGKVPEDKPVSPNPPGNSGNTKTDPPATGSQKNDNPGNANPQGKPDDKSTVDDKGKAGGNQGKNGGNQGNGNGNQGKANGNQSKADDKGFLNTIKSWFGFGEKKENPSQQPRAESPGAEGAGAETDKSGSTAQPRPDEKKPEPKVEEKQPEPKAEEKKAEPKAEEKKPEPKVEEKKPEPKVEEKKAEPKAEEKGSNSDKEKEKGSGGGKSQEKP